MFEILQVDYSPFEYLNCMNGGPIEMSTLICGIDQEY